MAARNLIWMANGRYGAWVPCPDTGLDRSVEGLSEKTKYLDGGSYVQRSAASARGYRLGWTGYTSADLQPVEDLYNGSYGPGPFYFLDPMARRNLLPSNWADPYLSTVQGGWPSLMRGVKATHAANAISSTYTPPTFQATYVFPSAIPAFSSLTPRATICIPPGATLSLKAWGSRTGTAEYRINIYNRSTGGLSTQGLVPTATGASTTFNGTTVSHVEIWLSKTTTGTDSAITLGGFLATVFTLPAAWYAGEGHNGLEFNGGLQETAYQSETGSLLSNTAFTVSMEEIGPWLQ